MPIYYYQGVDKQGKTIKGSMYADDEASLDQRLRSVGVWVVHATKDLETPAKKVKESDAGASVSPGKRRRALIDFCTMMYFQTKAGVPLDAALDSFAGHYETLSFRRVVAGVQKRLESGDQFYEALAHYPRYFSSEFVGIIKVGESTGNLPETFRSLKLYLEWVQKVVADTRQATLYPIIVFSVVSVFVIFLFAAVVPKFSALLERLGTDLPWITVAVFAVSRAIRSTWYFWSIGLIVVVISVRQAYRRSAKFKLYFDRVKLKIPLFGELNYMLCMSRLSNNFLVLYRAGVPLLQALEMCEGLVGNSVVSQGIVGVRQSVERGDGLTKAMERHKIFPPMLLRMVHIGETTGALNAALTDVAEYYAQIVPARIKAILTVMEPLFMVGLIFIVLTVAVAIYQPLIALVGSVRKL